LTPIVIVMTNTVFREFLGYLMPKSSKGNNFFRFVPPEERVLWRETGRAEWTMAIIYKSYTGRVLKTVNIYVNIGTNRYFKVIPQRK